MKAIQHMKTFLSSVKKKDLSSKSPPPISTQCEAWTIKYAEICDAVAERVAVDLFPEGTKRPTKALTVASLESYLLVQKNNKQPADTETQD